MTIRHRSTAGGIATLTVRLVDKAVTLLRNVTVSHATLSIEIHFREAILVQLTLFGNILRSVLNFASLLYQLFFDVNCCFLLYSSMNRLMNRLIDLLG